VAAAAAPAPSASQPPPEAQVRKTSNRNVLEELERLRQEAMSGPTRATATRAAAGKNGSGELRRDIQLTLTRDDFRRARRFSVTLQVEDEDQQVVEAVRNLRVDLKNTESVEKLLLRLNIALAAK